MIFIRVDTNNKISLGHIMRCINIANSLKKLNVELTFIVSDKISEDFLIPFNFNTVNINSNYNNLNNDFPALVNLIEKYNPNIILVDSYFATEQYFSCLKKYVKIVYIDDLCNNNFSVDLLINYSLTSKYKKNKNTKYLLGLNYFPLNKSFKKLDYCIRKNPMDILITTGGADKYEITEKLLQLITKNKITNINFHVIVGKFYKNYSNLKSLSENFNNIILYKNLTNLYNVMIKCDLAITACGSTIYELLALGIPMVAFSIEKNQDKNLLALKNLDICQTISNINKNIDTLYNMMLKYFNDYEYRYNFNKNNSNLIDHKGSERIAIEIIKLI